MIFTHTSWLRSICLFIEIIGLWWGFLGANLAHAQSSQPVAQKDLFNLPFEELAQLEVSVASKTKEPIERAPSSVTVFTQEDIRSLGISRLDELINFVPGFQVVRDGEQGVTSVVVARGRGSPSSGTVLFLVDGQRLNDLYTGNVSIINKLIPVENIKQVEIIRGPGSALYGSNAFLGVINIVTLTKANNAQVRAGSHGGHEMSANISGKIGQTDLSVFAQSFGDQGDTYRLSDNIDDDTTSDPRRGIDLYATWQWENLTIHASHTDRLLRDFYEFAAVADGINRDRTVETFVNAQYRINQGERLEMDVSLGYLQNQWDAVTRNFPAGTEIVPGLILEKDFISGPFLESFSSNVALDTRYKVSAANQLAAGISYERAGISDVGGYGSFNPVTLEPQADLTLFRDPEVNFNAERDRNIFGAYLQDKHNLDQAWVLTAGVRYDYYSVIGGSLNPRAALVYQTPFNSHIKFLYGRAFRAPNFLELYDKNNPVDFGNTALNPETVDTFELAYLQNFHSCTGAITFFLNQTDDVIILGTPVESPENPFGAQTFSNEGSLNTRGLELEGSLKLSNPLSLRATYTHFLELESLPAPVNFGSLIAHYAHEHFILNVNTIIRESFGRLATQSAYGILNTALEVPLAKRLSLIARVDNILNDQYRTFTSIIPEGIPNRGREFWAGLRYEFD